ncbi:MAG: hypothetical protein KAY24_16195 [Candidatus Eisenbacteria sp.]|nr:hypothetical protein [Candidatus Eisenbacteria bacterium]
MKRHLSCRRTDQLGLFRPPPRTPAWRTLPREIKQRTTTLLAQMLREHRAERLASKGKEAPGE